MPRAKKAQAPARRARKDSRKERTRQRLIDATIDIARHHGVGALTTGKIANGAGIQQPGFYAHFKNVDECLQASARQVSAQIVETEARIGRTRVFAAKPEERLREAIERARFGLHLWVENRRFAELFFRCRYDATPIGEVCRDTDERVKSALVEDLWDLAASQGLRARYLEEIDLMAAMLVANFTGAVELVLSGKCKDIDAVAVALGRNQHYYVRAELARMLDEQHAEGAEATGS